RDQVRRLPARRRRPDHPRRRHRASGQLAPPTARPAGGRHALTRGRAVCRVVPSREEERRDVVRVLARGVGGRARPALPAVLPARRLVPPRPVRAALHAAAAPLAFPGHRPLNRCPRTPSPSAPTTTDRPSPPSCAPCCPARAGARPAASSRRAASRSTAT